MVSLLASMAALPFLALVACGEAPVTNDNSAPRTRGLNGVAMQDGPLRIYECNAALSSPVNNTLRMRVGEEPLPILLLRIEQGANTFWWALNHLDKAVHRRADPPFPVSARTEGDRTILEWNIHSNHVVASLEWRSPAQDRAGVEFECDGDSGPVTAYPTEIQTSPGAGSVG